MPVHDSRLQGGSKRPKRAYASPASSTKRRVYVGREVQSAMLNAMRQSISAQSSLGPVAQQAIRVGGWANPSRMGELKFVDTSFSSDPPAGSVAFTAATLLNGLVPGSTASQRIGRKVTIKSMLIRYQNKLAPTSVGGSPVRILIVYDKQANTNTAGITDILLTDSANSPNNLSNRDRFVTLCDHISAPVSVENDFQVADIIYKPLNLETMFNEGNAGTIGDITTGSILMFVAQFGGITVASPDFSASCRIRYSDV